MKALISLQLLVPTREVCSNARFTEQSTGR